MKGIICTMVGPNSLLQGGERRLGKQGGELSPYLASNRRALVITFNYKKMLTEYIDGAPDKPLLYTAALD